MKKIYLLIACLFFLVPFASAYKLPGSTIVNTPAPPSSIGFLPTGITVAGDNGPGSSVSQLNFPSGIFVDATGYIYITDGSNSRIQKWAPGYSVGVTVAGGNGTGSQLNQLNFQSDVFVDPEGNIYIDL